MSTLKIKQNSYVIIVDKKVVLYNLDILNTIFFYRLFEYVILK